MPTKRTHEQMVMDKYVVERGIRCPVCHSEDLEYGAVDDTLAGEMSQYVYCIDCESNWTDTYKLAGYTALLDMPKQLGKELT